MKDTTKTINIYIGKIQLPKITKLKKKKQRKTKQIQTNISATPASIYGLNMGWLND